MSEEQQAGSSEQELLRVRREKLDALVARGVDPFGGGSGHRTTHQPGVLRKAFANEEEVMVAGRMVSRRDMGRSRFFDLADVSGRMQCYLNEKGVGAEGFEIFDLLDIGDWVHVEGTTFTTKVGEPSINASRITVLSKSLRPMPDKHHGVSDRELKYRQRYLDLMSNQASRDTFVTRSLMLAEMRRFLIDRGYLEVETPMLQDIPGGAAARPFETYHNALDMPLYLRIAPELYLKRMLVGGFTRVFELNRNFRNEGISRRHNPEFTMLEAYQAFADFEIMANLVEELVCHLAETFCGGLKIDHQNEEGEIIRTIDLTRPWRRAKYRDLIRDLDPRWFDYSSEERLARCRELGVEAGQAMEEYEVTQQMFEKLIEEKSFDPVFVTHVPTELVPLAKQNAADDSIVDVYELIINGQEISPGYSELNNPIIQRERLEHQAGEEVQKVDYEFITALEHGMPPAGGFGLGIDRLIMMLTGAATIRDVVLFPQLKRKAEKGE